MHVMKSLNILCFGDSITAGWSQGGAVIHPYADSMLRSLEKALNMPNIAADVQGNPGDQVTTPPGGFLTRMDILYEENEPYDWAVILGGTNDLYNNRKGEDIYDALLNVWGYPLGNGTKVLALTVPECSFCSPDFEDRRQTLNDLILNHEAPNFYKLDLSEKMPYWKMPEGERNMIWDDGVHFTAKGYDLMGKIIAKRLIELIGKTEGVQTAQKPVKVDLKARNIKSAPETQLVEGKRLRSGTVLAREVEVIE